jgi:hypothetical protein
VAPAEGDDLALQASHPAPTTPPPTAGTIRAA